MIFFEPQTPSNIKGNSQHDVIITLRRHTKSLLQKLSDQSLTEVIFLPWSLRREHLSAVPVVVGTGRAHSEPKSKTALC